MKELLTDREGQLQSGELVMVVMVVMLILIIGLVLYYSVKQEALKQSYYELQSLTAAKVAREAVYLKEVACNYASETVPNCLDKLRLDSFATMTKALEPNSREDKYYRSLFGAALIKVEQVYPSREGWVLYNKSLTGERTPVMLPVSIYDPLSKTHGLGFLTMVKG